jgi:hypothetical protein
MNTRIHSPLKIVAINANSITRQRYELRRQLQTRRIDMALLLEQTLSLTRDFPLEIIIFIGMIATRVQKVKLRLQSEKGSHIAM